MQTLIWMHSFYMRWVWKIVLNGYMKFGMNVNVCMHATFYYISVLFDNYSKGLVQTYCTRACLQWYSTIWNHSKLMLLRVLGVKLGSFYWELGDAKALKPCLQLPRSCRNLCTVSCEVLSTGLTVYILCLEGKHNLASVIYSTIVTEEGGTFLNCHKIDCHQEIK